MTKEKLLSSIEKTLKETIESCNSELSSLSDVDKAKVQGISEGAKIGLEFVNRINDGVSYENAISSFNDKLRQAIYSLMNAESKHEKNKSTVGYDVEYQIVYNDNLVNTLQLLRNKFEDIELAD